MTSPSAELARSITPPPHSRAPVSRRRSSFREHFAPLLKAHRFTLIVALVLVATSGAAIAIQNAYPKWLFSWVLEAKDVSPQERWYRLLLLAAGYVVVSTVMRMLCWHAGYRLFTKVREKIIFTLRVRFFRHVNDLCLRFHRDHPSGELYSYLFGSPLTSLMQFYQHVSSFVPGAVLTVVITLGLFLAWDWPIASMLLGASVMSVLMMMRSRIHMTGLNREYQAIEGGVSGLVADLLRGTKAVKLYAMERQIEERFSSEAEFVARKSYEKDIRAHLEWMKQETFSYFCYAMLMLACAWRYLSGHIDLGIVAACLAAYPGLAGPLQAIFTAFTLSGAATASLDRIGAVLEETSSTPDPESPGAGVPQASVVSLDDVTFAYDEGNPVLRNISLAIAPGERIALVGRSGCGKSTIAQLLLRLYDPQQGAVRIGGEDARGFSGSQLRRHFGVVPQDPFLFDTTIRDNVRVAAPNASDAEIRQACEQASAWEFIETIPGGLDAPVGEGGAHLSGGQRQRLAIARVLLAKPPFFIFDEATSALDNVSERLIQKVMEENLGDSSVLFIAHRLTTVRHCDRILVIADGKVTQEGSYDELAEQPGIFQDLVRGQKLRA